jgi:hypothetical protein
MKTNCSRIQFLAAAGMAAGATMAQPKRASNLYVSGE